ncbi:MAG TPA: biopolymer transporter ExbD [Longimicrobium sp.]|nr:biopolymer transporter ExbD [Longimicrobium sp.]
MGWDVVGRARTPFIRMDVTPFVGVVMVLLIVAITLAPSDMPGHGLPRARTGEPMRAPRVTLGIDSRGEFWIEDVPDPGPIPLAALAGRLAQAGAGDAEGGEGAIYLKAAPGTDYAYVQAALGAARRAGVRRVGLVTGRPLHAPRR